MFSGRQTEEELIQNLTDAGCADDTAVSILDCIRQGQMQKGLLLLQGQREALLEGIHKEQKCIRFLDDLLSRMQNAPTGHFFPGGSGTV